MGYRLLLFVVILAVNAFFSAAEVALVCVRRSRIEPLARQGNTAAQAALSLLSNPERLLSVSQVGITLGSLGLGWAGEETIYELIVHAMGPLPVGSPSVLRGASFAIAFLFMSFAHVVIGEVVPKNLALERAERLALLVSPPMLIFYKISLPFVYLVERTSAVLSRWLGLKGLPHAGGHSSEELRFIVASSLEQGHLDAFEKNAITHLLELQNYVVREIMVPRNDIVSIPVEASLEQVLRTCMDHQYSRLPVYEDRPENIIGIVHYKDLIPIWEERRRAFERRRPVRPFRLWRVVRKAPVVPETKVLTQLVDDFRGHRTHMALVVDEFGTIVGLVTLEDVLEQVFGDIRDEHDELRQAPQLEAALLEVDGSTTIRTLETQYGLDLPAEGGFETLAGFLLFHLGTIPRPGDVVEHSGRRFTVLEMERNRVARVRIERL